MCVRGLWTSTDMALIIKEEILRRLQICTVLCFVFFVAQVTSKGSRINNDCFCFYPSSVRRPGGIVRECHSEDRVGESLLFKKHAYGRVRWR